MKAFRVNGVFKKSQVVAGFSKMLDKKGNPDPTGWRTTRFMLVLSTPDLKGNYTEGKILQSSWDTRKDVPLGWQVLLKGEADTMEKAFDSLDSE